MLIRDNLNPSVSLGNAGFSARRVLMYVKTCLDSAFLQWSTNKSNNANDWSVSKYEKSATPGTIGEPVFLILSK